MLVTLEGIDGAGKTTVREELSDEFPDAVFTREPTESWLGDAVKRSIGDDDSDPLTDLFLFVADHADHIRRVIEPALEDDRLVICDRYIDSRFAYQSVALEGREGIDDPTEWIRGLHEGWTVVPDLTLLLDIDPETAVERLGGEDERIKFERVEYLREVRENYLELAEASDRFVVVDAERDSETVTRDCVEVLESCM
ncbi:MAG: dTMP kinase [Halobacteria archaeon]|nr:dTMP kinase [Halobacteria archaeon]